MSIYIRRTVVEINFKKGFEKIAKEKSKSKRMAIGASAGAAGAGLYGISRPHDMEVSLKKGTHKTAPMKNAKMQSFAKYLERKGPLKFNKGKLLTSNKKLMAAGALTGGLAGLLSSKKKKD